MIRDVGQKIGDPCCYWDLAVVAEHGVADRGQVDPTELADELDCVLRHAVKSRMASDVPLGAFLSGGFDSTMVAALMQAQSSQPVKTFTIGFHEKGYNEAVHAKAVAKHLGTDHTELYVSPEVAMAVIPRLPSICDEPFSDSSQIPTLLVSELARKYVTVSLSGDGGDELFCGYNRYTQGYQVWQRLQRFLTSLRHLVSNLMRVIPARKLEFLVQYLSKDKPIPQIEGHLLKLAEVLNADTGLDYYKSLVSHWKEPDQLVFGANEPRTIIDSSDKFLKFSAPRCFEWVIVANA